MIIDTNADLVNCEFRDPRYMDDTINEAQRAGISCCIESGMTLEGSEIALGLKHSYPGFIFPAVGIAGTEAHKEKWRNRKELEAYARSPSVVAIGEIGLDYSGRRASQHRGSQKRWLRYQLRLAKKRKLPVIIQVRRAHKQILGILRCYRGRKYGGVIRATDLTPELAKKYLKMGYHVSVGRHILYDAQKGTAFRSVVCCVPINRIVVESEGYYATPEWDETGPSKEILPQVIQKIAEIKEIPPRIVEQTLAENTINLFRLPIIPFFHEEV